VPTTDRRVRDAAAADLDAATIYRIMALRSDVFVLEQQCIYLDLDGRDLEPAVRHVWVEAADGEVLATLRVLPEPDGTVRIGRVATAASARGQGLAARMLERGIELCGDRPVVLAAQSHLTRWYEGLGFVRAGDDFVEDGIDHTPMRLSRNPTPGGASATT
jgi:ElaA protein